MANEQWLTDGNCQECRRRAYCSKRCKRNREARDRELHDLITSVFAKAMLKGNRQKPDPEREEPEENNQHGSRTETEAQDDKKTI